VASPTQKWAAKRAAFSKFPSLLSSFWGVVVKEADRLGKPPRRVPAKENEKVKRFETQPQLNLQDILVVRRGIKTASASVRLQILDRTSASVLMKKEEHSMPRRR
jgi:hypothetical protein